MNEISSYSVYALIDPRTQRIHYIGITSTDLELRLRSHMGDRKTNSKKATWIEELRQLGLEPLIRVVENILSSCGPNKREKYWIQHYRNAGEPLTNIVHNAIAQPWLAGEDVRHQEKVR